MAIRDEDQKLENESKAAFANFRKMQIEAPPFMQSRVLAHTHSRKLEREITIWRSVSVLFAAACAVLLFMRVNQSAAPNSDERYVHQNYVINLDLEGEQLKVASEIEVELPDGVAFVSERHPEIAQNKKLRLPISNTAATHRRLPFVVRSENAGLKNLKMRVLNEDGEVVSEHTLSVNFKDQENRKFL